MSSSVPQAARLLGGLGLLPFVGLASSLIFMDDADRPRAALALLAYGAVILSFLGGVQWGLAIAANPPGPLMQRLVLSVIPSLLAWVALLLPNKTGLGLLALSFALMLWLDLRSVARQEAPAWYAQLRLPLSGAVTASLLSALFW